MKEAAALANRDLGLLDKKTADAIVEACRMVRDGKFDDQFVVDMVQGGAGTSTNMNANEVIANIALELMGHKKGEYKYCHPNNHVNLSQSTNDAYPTAMKIALIRSIAKPGGLPQTARGGFPCQGRRVRRRHQDGTHAVAGRRTDDTRAGVRSLCSEPLRRDGAAGTELQSLFYEMNMGATAIGTGINADPDYPAICEKYLREITGLPMVVASNMIEATNDTGAFVMNSSALKRLAVKLSKICNDLRLLSSGPRCGLNEINLPPRQPGSSIMPGKVNPVIPEVVNQVAFRVIGNDLTVTMAAEAGQLELNVMEPIIIHCLFESIEMLANAMNTLREKCVTGITANKEVCRNMVYNSIGLVTALNPYLGYETSTMLAGRRSTAARASTTSCSNTNS